MATLSTTRNPSPRTRAEPDALDTRVALAILALAAICMRLGALWTEQIDWDEWSFILMGADVAQGHLPFVHQFDLKPPLVFMLVGATIALFGKSLVAVRLLGTLCVLVAASFVFLTARRVAPAWAALAGGLITIALASAPFGLATSSELPAIAFLGAALWRLGRSPLSLREAFAGGLLVCLAALTRTNLAVVALALGLLLLGASLLRKGHVPRLAWLAYGIGGLTPLALLIACYAAAGELATLKLAMIDVPLAYSGQLTALEVAKSHALQLYYTASEAPLLYLPAAALAGIGSTFALLRLLRPESDEDRWLILAVLTAALAVTCSLLIGGAAYPHYWLQLVPFAGFLAALAVAGATRASKALGAGVGVLVLLPLAVTLASSLTQAPASYRSDHPITRAASYIRQTGGEHPTVWALHKHLVHWYLDAPQLSRASVHPDNLGRRAIIDTLAAHGYVSHNEVGRLMAHRPEFVVTDAGGKGVAWVRATGADVDRWLAANYREEVRFGDVVVLRRR
jgi:4-amino-4-deoxy-L-arabinose transferase-like glycosyltransferase